MTGKAETDVKRVRVVSDLAALSEPVTALYVRVTAEESFTKDLSVPNQKRRGLEVCAERGWTVAKLYAEPRHVGGDLGPEHRPALAELLADIAASKVARVLVRHTDRLWRSTTVQDRLLRVFAAHGVELWDFATQHDYRSAHGKFTTFVLGAAAQLEKELTGERIREMKRGKALAGKPGGGPPPFGYSSQARVRHELLAAGGSPEAAAEEACRRYPAPGRFYVDPAEAAIVRRAFELYTRDGLGCRRLSDILNSEGHRRRSGLPWVAQKVTRVLTDPVVAGFLTYDEEAFKERRPARAPKHRQTLFPGEHEAIIVKETWEAALALRERNRLLLRTKARQSRTYPLLGVLFCGMCGGKLVGKASGEGRRTYYQCSARKYRGERYGCAFPLLPAPVVEQVVLDAIGELLRAPELVHDFMQKANERLRNETPEAAKDLARLEKQLALVSQAADKFTRRYENASDPESEEVAWDKLKEAMTKKKALEKEVTERRAALSSYRPEELTLASTRKYLARLTGEVGKNPERALRLLRLLVRRHGLRVRAFDKQRLLLTLRLDPASFTSGKGSLRLISESAEGKAAPLAHVFTRELCLPEPDTAKSWAERENRDNPRRCGCGCGEAVLLTARHRYTGRLPRFRLGHHEMAMEQLGAKLEAAGLLTIGRAAGCLGVSVKVLRTRDHDFGLRAEWRSVGKRAPMRCYRKEAVEAAREKRRSELPAANPLRKGESP